MINRSISSSVKFSGTSPKADFLLPIVNEASSLMLMKWAILYEVEDYLAG
jgi:hypothetical protein